MTDQEIIDRLTAEQAAMQQQRQDVVNTLIEYANDLIAPAAEETEE